MSDEFFYIDEPSSVFCHSQLASDPHDGLALFGAYGSNPSSVTTMPPHVVIGTTDGIRLWNNWAQYLNRPASCLDISRQRPWPPFPGYDVAFGAIWPSPTKEFRLDNDLLDQNSRKLNRNERSFSVANQYLEAFNAIKKFDSQPALAVCVVPDYVYQNCRPKSYVADVSDAPDKLMLSIGKQKAKTGQTSLFENPDFVGEAIDDSEQFGYSVDFRRQLKARVMPLGIPIQIIKESTLTLTEQIINGDRGTNPLSDRLWNLGTALYYKSGNKPWKIAGARDGVCYIGLSYKLEEGSNKTACCAAQMFVDSGDGIVFLGDFGPWYSAESKQFHLTEAAAEELLRGTLHTYYEQGGPEINEIFLHSKSGISRDEFKGFQRAAPQNCRVVGIRVSLDRGGLRLFRDGKRPVLRGTLWKRTPRFGYLYTNGFKPRLATYDGFEIPVPLQLAVQQGECDIETVARDILTLTKLNYNACLLGEGMPITVKFSAAIGEILLANPSLKQTDYQHTFKYYI